MSAPFGAFCEAADDVSPSTPATNAAAANTTAAINAWILFTVTPSDCRVRSVVERWASPFSLATTERPFGPDVRLTPLFGFGTAAEIARPADRPRHRSQCPLRPSRRSRTRRRSFVTCRPRTLRTRWRDYLLAR